MTEQRTFLVTGAAGCIGAWVIAKLLRRGDRAVAFDISDNRRRLRLLLDGPAADRVPWIIGDLTDTGAVDRALVESDATAIIHLAALQIPFCKADPVAGAKVNVVGQVNIFEAARKHRINHLVYASSIAALPPEGEDLPATLYGVYKAADEGIAHVYAKDWSVPSIGLRPHTVYGLGRDQGLTSAPTKAMLAAVAGQPFTIPFAGPLNLQHAGEVADIFIRGAEAEVAPDHTAVHDLQGTTMDVGTIADLIRQQVPRARITVSGPSLPFPASFDDAPLRRTIGAWPSVKPEAGIADTISAFDRLLRQGLIAFAD
ncbi:MAG: NAD-dependent epimerase/dehydratase family protein [Dongiaceae bacterium]